MHRLVWQDWSKTAFIYTEETLLWFWIVGALSQSIRGNPAAFCYRRCWLLSACCSFPLWAAWRPSFKAWKTADQYLCLACFKWLGHAPLYLFLNVSLILVPFLRVQWKWIRFSVACLEREQQNVCFPDLFPVSTHFGSDLVCDWFERLC